jgi:hypothetical protein
MICIGYQHFSTVGENGYGVISRVSLDGYQRYSAYDVYRIGV